MYTMVSVGRPRVDATVPAGVLELLPTLTRACFSTEATRIAIGKLLREQPELASWVRTDTRAALPLASDERLFPSSSEEIALVLRDRGFEHEISLSPAEGAQLGELLRARDQEELHNLVGGAVGPDLDVDARGQEAEAKTWPQVDRPGVYRREHACLVVRSRDASVLIDPVARLAGSLPGLDRAPGHSDIPDLAAIAITHSHRDHWHLPTILHAAGRSDIPVVVPVVPRINLLCTLDFEDDLNVLGQASMAPGWGRTIEFGDLEIDILPFRGEQPTVVGPGAPPGVRNFGNCYRFTCSEFSVMVMVDSGTDPEGSVDEVLAQSVRDRGPPDLILACLRQFEAPFFGGLPVDWLSLSPSRLEQLWKDREAGQLSSVTQGPRGWATAAACAGARQFMAYAHGFEGIGMPIRDSGWGHGEPSEQELLAELEASNPGSNCRVAVWNPGDWVSFGRGTLEVHRAEPR